MLASLFGYGGSSSTESPSPGQAEAKPKAKKGFFSSIVSNMFGSHFMQVLERLCLPAVI